MVNKYVTWTELARHPEACFDSESDLKPQAD